MAEPNLIAQSLSVTARSFWTLDREMLGGAQIKGMTYDAMSGDGSVFADTLKCC